VLLKDVLDHSLEETAALTGSTIGGVKAALHRGRAKLQHADVAPVPPRPLPDVARLYAERFARRDWDGVRALLADDARLRVADCYQGPVAGAPYFDNYERIPRPWTARAGFVDGAPVVLVETADAPVTAIRLEIVGARIVRITDFAHCPWVVPAAAVVGFA
jgi:RNA polymerase sigma-70 factor (ECF subfamily)